MPKKATKSKSRRRTAAKPKKKTAARRRTQKVSGAKPELDVYVNPHSNATSHPKIPDGKVKRSLGLSNQAAGELIALQTPIAAHGTASPGDGTIHILMYAGQNSGAIIMNTLGSANPINGGGAYTSEIRCGEFMSWSGCPDVAIQAGFSATGGTLGTSFEYSQWRCVSQGLLLGLLNPAEEDDGWWECIRVNDPLETGDFSVLPRDRDHSTVSNMTLTPARKLYGDLMGRNDLPNTPSYQTGLLRDIHEHYFQLAPAYNDHEFSQEMDLVTFGATDVVNAGTVGTAQDGRFVQFEDGSDDVRGYINQKIDKSFDMIYLRIHGRSATTPSRLHYNLVNNAEVTYAGNTIEARFMTPTKFDEKGVQRMKDIIHKTDDTIMKGRGKYRPQVSN